MRRREPRSTNAPAASSPTRPAAPSSVRSERRLAVLAIGVGQWTPPQIVPHLLNHREYPLRPRDDDVLKLPAFNEWFGRGIFSLMKLRLLAHCLVLALFVTATVLAGVVTPASAGFGQMDAGETAMSMDVAMPCCPTDQGSSKDCTTNCPALSFCLAKCFASEPTDFVKLVRPVIAQLGLGGDDADHVSRPFEPPARPPRT